MNTTMGLIFILCAYGAAMVIDCRQHRLPDWITWPTAIVAVPVSLQIGHSFPDMLMGIIWMTGILFFFFRKNCVGLGDVKLGLSLGALSGGIGAIISLAFAVMGVTFWRGACQREKDKLPFGPALISSFFLVFPFSYIL